MLVSPFNLHANAVTADYTAAKTRYKSFVGIYTEFADGYFRRYERGGENQEMWRAKIELQLLKEVDNAEIPIEHKLSWYKKIVLDASDFDPYWASISTRLNLPDECTAPLSRFQEGGEEEPKDETEDEADDEADDDADDERIADTDSEAGDIEEEDEVHVEEDVELQDEVSVEGQNDIDGRSTVTDPQSRVSSPDSSSDSWESDNDPRDHPLFFTRIRKAFPTKLCNLCDSTGHTTKQHPTFDWADWESDSSGGSIGKHRAKTYGKVLFVGLEPRPDEAVRDWHRRLDSAQEDPCTTWSTMNPRASIETNDAAWEDSPYGCECRHRKRGPTVSAAPHQHIAGEDPRSASGEGADGEYEASPSSSKAKGKAPVLNTVKSASKPKGVIKKAPMQPRRKNVPPPLKLIEAALPPAQASRDAEGSGSRVQGYVSPPPERGQGLKRMLEECSDDEEDGPPAKKAKVGGAAPPERGQGVKRMLEESSGDEEDEPPAKKAKVGGAASVDGGRKKLPLKKSSMKKRPMD